MRRLISRPARVDAGEQEAVVKAFFAHHHGMSLLALEQAVLGPLMQRRFLSNPDFQAATLLLQERIPKANVLMYPHVREVQVSRRASNRAAKPITRVIHQPEHAHPGSASALQRPLPRDGVGRRRRVQPMQRPGDHPLAGGPHVRVVRGLLLHQRSADPPRDGPIRFSRPCTSAGSTKRCSRGDGPNFAARMIRSRPTP